MCVGYGYEVNHNDIKLNRIYVIVYKLESF
jgi:hypothetical protein